MANADCIVLMGGNMAEAHPVGFQWVAEAKARGARVIHVDPRFTRTSAVVDKHIPMRVGSDIVLLGGLINYVLTHDKHFHDYVVAYTNAAALIDADFADPEDLGGLFSGFDPETERMTASWQYTGGRTRRSPIRSRCSRSSTALRPLRRTWSSRCGVSAADFDYLARSLTDNSGPERTGCFGYATSWTQHTMGAQVIRTAGILQLLLGNVGRPGSGIMALRGHASIQGSTDIPTLFNLLPGYLPMPSVGKHDTFADYVRAVTPATGKGYWAYADAYTVSLLKAWWGDAATAENDWAYDYLPASTARPGPTRPS